ncbi:hypothetical protein FQN57_001061 [Myotisia sp. PD_48]|nr:hypothetical protein FQN57_001061 [Myotisia sp. PD_48]
MYSPITQALASEIECRPGWKDAFTMAVMDAVQTAPMFMEKHKVKTLGDFLDHIDRMFKWIPDENSTATKVLQEVRVFYFIFAQESVRGYQTPVHPSTTRGPLSWLSQWIVQYSVELGEYLSTPESLTPESLDTFRKAGKYNLDDFIEPQGGWRTFNEFFARRIKPELRPISEPANPKIITSPADSMFRGVWPVEDNGVVTFKGISWRIQDLLQDSSYRDDFNGGIFVHSILLPSDYHRMHAPVGGKVLESRIIRAQALLEVICEEGRPRSDPNKDEGYQWCQMRGLIVVDSPIGRVAIIPVGMGHISSVVLDVAEGEKVTKGQEIAHFQFGGSDIVLVFQAASRMTITAEKNAKHPQAHYKVGEQIGVAR